MDNLREQLLRVVRLEEVVERYLPLGWTGSARLGKVTKRLGRNVVAKKI